MTILERALYSLTDSGMTFERVIFVGLAEHEKYFFEIASSFVTYFQFDFLGIREVLNGQAESVAVALADVPLDVQIVIWNGDTALRPGWRTEETQPGNWMLLSELEGDHWSFARLSGQKVLETSEKVRISKAASVGLYGFESKRVFLEALSADRMQKKNLSEIYVAPLYNHVISTGAEVQGWMISPQHFIPLGTPREVLESCVREGWGLPPELDHLL
jgi:dTDP-glucose pyrophosphorylase